MKANIALLFFLMLFVCSVEARRYGRNNSYDQNEREKVALEVERAVARIKVPNEITPAGMRVWRAKRDQVYNNVASQFDRIHTPPVLLARTLDRIHNMIYGGNLILHAHDIRKRVSEEDLLDKEFWQQEPTRDIRAIYDEHRNRLEDKLLKSNAIQRKKDLLKKIAEDYKLFNDREEVVIKDIRGKEYKGIFRQDRTTDKLARVGRFTLSRFDIALESRARIWKDDQKEFINKEVARLTRNNNIIVAEQSEETLDGVVQQAYLDAGYLPSIFERDSNIYSVDPKYWYSRKAFLEYCCRMYRRVNIGIQMENLGYEEYDIGDGFEYVPSAVVKAKANYILNCEKAKQQIYKQHEDWDRGR